MADMVALESAAALTLATQPPREWLVQPWAVCRSAWSNLATRANGTTLSHDERWLRLLEQVYGFEIIVAGIAGGSQLNAACLLARTRNPFNRRLVALPFSDT